MICVTITLIVCYLHDYMGIENFFIKKIYDYFLYSDYFISS